MNFSLVLATLDRVKEVEQFLMSLDAQTYRQFEVILVDQNRDDRLVSLVEKYSTGLRIHHFRTENRGLSRARNFGLAKASGEIVAFPDDDCQYPEDLLQKLRDFFVERSGVDVLTGRSVDHAGKTSNGRFHLVPGKVDKKNVWFRSVEYTIFLYLERTRGHAFDEDIGIGAGTKMGAGEGIDLLMSLLESGATVQYDPDIVVIHGSPYVKYDARAFKKAGSYGYGMSQVIKRHDMSMRFKVRWVVRAVGATVLALMRRDWLEARYRWSIFTGRVRGLLG